MKSKPIKFHKWTWDHMGRWELRYCFEETAPDGTPTTSNESIITILARSRIDGKPYFMTQTVRIADDGIFTHEVKHLEWDTLAAAEVWTTNVFRHLNPDLADLTWPPVTSLWEGK